MKLGAGTHQIGMFNGIDVRFVTRRVDKAIWGFGFSKHDLTPELKTVNVSG